MPSTCRVRLLVSRTGFGHAGEIVEYPADEAGRHASLGLVELLDRAAAAVPADESPEDGPAPEPAGETDPAPQEEPGRRPRKRGK